MYIIRVEGQEYIFTDIVINRVEYTDTNTDDVISRNATVFLNYKIEGLDILGGIIWEEEPAFSIIQLPAIIADIRINT